MKISPARVAAFEILKRIETERAFSAVLLPEYESGLSRKDAALCHELVLGVLRRQMYLDRLADEVGKARKLDLAVRIALRLGIYQLIFLDKIPSYSAISESVDLVHRAKKTSARGYVNAVLRNVQRGVPGIQFKDEIERLSVEQSHPRWLVEKWVRDIGEERTSKIVEANNRTPETVFRVTAKGGNAGFIPNVESRPSEFVDGGSIVERAGRELLDAAAEGKIYFQDEGSQIVGQAVDLKRDEKFLDVCASPGSKATQIAAAAGDGPLMVAGDLHFSRVKLLRESCRRQGVSFVSVVQYDAEIELPFREGVFDSVLVDAPCTGTGTIRHNPEIRYFLDAADPAILGAKQLRILQNASKMVKSGGQLIYSTCSLEPEENEGVAEAFTASNGKFEKRVPRVADRFMTADGFARTWPGRDELDGFFIAAFGRAAD